MIQKNSFYKGVDFLQENNREVMQNYFNPYEYNFESNLKDKLNSDICKTKSNSHTRNKIKKNNN